MTPIILVTGHPASGKTTLSKQIASQFALPLFHKDTMKEILFDTLGYSNREWSKKLGKASIETLYTILEQCLKTKTPCIVESTFWPELDTPRLLQLQNTYPFKALQILCYADGDVLFERFKYRACFGKRHPGHADCDNLEEFKIKLHQTKQSPLQIAGEILEIDTTDFKHIAYPDLFEKIRLFLQ